MKDLETVSITSRDYSSPGGKPVTREYKVMNVTDDLSTGKSAEEFMEENNITLDFENADRLINRELIVGQRELWDPSKTKTVSDDPPHYDPKKQQHRYNLGGVSRY